MTSHRAVKFIKEEYEQVHQHCLVYLHHVNNFECILPNSLLCSCILSTSLKNFTNQIQINCAAAIALKYCIKPDRVQLSEHSGTLTLDVTNPTVEAERPTSFSQEFKKISNDKPENTMSCIIQTFPSSSSLGLSIEMQHSTGHEIKVTLKSKLN